MRLDRLCDAAYSGRSAVLAVGILLLKFNKYKFNLSSITRID